MRSSRSVRQAHWQHVISDYQQSGLSRRAFCEQRDIKLHQLNYYLKRHLPSKKGESSTDRVASDFIPLKIRNDIPANKQIKAPDYFTLRFPNGIVCQVDAHFNADALCRLVEVVAHATHFQGR